MKAAYIKQTGPPENIIYGELPTPKPTDSQVLVRVSAVAVNPIDTYIRSGAVQMPLALPFIVGCDVAGVVEMAKAIGARVITTAGTPEKLNLCRQLGADLAINYKTEDVDARIKEFAPDGVNVWWETLREPNFERTVPLLARRGRMIVTA